MPSSEFARQLEIGRAGERLVLRFIKGRGAGVIPSYDFTGTDGSKAPKLSFSSNSLVVPDLDAASNGRRLWVEVKTFATSVVFRKYGIRVHGIRRRHYDDYLSVEKETGNDVFLSVLEVDTAKLLVAKLRELTPYSCICRACQAGTPGRHCEVYFDRSSFVAWTEFKDTDMAPLRQLLSEAA